MPRRSASSDEEADTPRISGERLGWVLALAAAALVLLASSVHRYDVDRRAAHSFPIEKGRFPDAARGERLDLPWVTGTVTVARDERGVPHLSAIKERDVWVALGFVHAQDRLAQMLWLRRLARGTTAEVRGSAGLDCDRVARTLGIGRLADAEVERLAPETLRVLQAYAEGVNGRLERLRRGAVSPPADLLGAVSDVDPWLPADAIAIQKLVAFAAGNLIETGLVLDDLTRHLGGQPAQPFMPSSSGGRGVEVPQSGPLALLETSPSLPVDERPTPTLELVRSVMIRGGDALVLGGQHSRSGAPMLVGDLRLPPTVPSLLHEVHLRAGDLDVIGAMIPGIPVIWAGSNVRVAWLAAPTNAMTVDLFNEVIRERDQHYQNGSVWEALEHREERLRVRRTGAGESGFDEVVLDVRATRHGPLIGPLLRPSAQGEGAADSGRPARSPLALQWTGMEPGNGIASMLALMRAGSEDQLLAALERHHEPVVAVTYAEVLGAAGMHVAGWLPERRMVTGGVPVHGRFRRYDWRRPIEFSALPAQRLPAGGDRIWLVSSDGEVGDGLSGARIEWLWRDGRRSRRLHGRLEGLTDGGERRGDLGELLGRSPDLSGGQAQEVVPALLRLSQQGGRLRPEAREVAQMLARWDGDVGAASQGAAVYAVFMEHFSSALFRERFGDALYARYTTLPHTHLISVAEAVVVASDRAARPGGWTDLQDVSDAVRSSLRHTWLSLSQRLGPARDRWVFGELQKLMLRPFAPAAAGRDAPSLPALSLPADAYHLDGFEYDARAGGYPVGAAAIYRFGVDLAARDRNVGMLLPGQSEHPRHPHYDDGFVRWHDRSGPLVFTKRLFDRGDGGAALALEPAL